MKSTKITRDNHFLGFKTPSDTVIVRAKSFNDLKDDFDVLRPSDTSIKTNTVSEVTPGAGVTIDGVILKDNKVTATGGVGLSTNVEQYTVEVNLSAADLIAMYTTPVQVVAAPGAGYALNFRNAVLIYDSTATAFTGGGVITINYGSGGAAQSSNLAATFLTGAGDKVYNLERLNAAGGLTMAVNTALVITNASAAFATGTGVCRLQITYTVHATNL